MNRFVKKIGMREFLNLKRDAFRFSHSIDCISKSVRLFFLVLLFAFNVFSQNLPAEFLGYKIYKAKITVKNQADKAVPTNAAGNDDADVFIKLSDPQPIKVSLTDLTFEISGEVFTLKQSGQVDFLVFKDFRVNGLPIEIEDYKQSFEFKKNQITRFPQPVKISLSFTQAMRGVLGEWRESKEFWQVTGRAFVFGRFRKAGFKFKRVVPVDINLQIKNPLKQ